MRCELTALDQSKVWCSGPIDCWPGPLDQRPRLVDVLGPLATKKNDPSLGEILITGISRLVECNCVGIRLFLNDGTLAYSTCIGFSNEFWLAENLISTRCDQCACTRVVLGHPEPQDLAAMTPGGSFCTAQLAEFASSLTAEELTRFRGRCIDEGFQSLAIIPIPHAGQVIGALHLADKRPDRVSSTMVAELEASASAIGDLLSDHVAFSGRPTRFACPSTMDAMLNGIGVISYTADPKTHQILYANQTLRNLLTDDPIGKLCYQQLHGLNRPCASCGNAGARQGNPHLQERTYPSPDGDQPYLVTDRAIDWDDGRTVWLCFGVPSPAKP